MVIFILLPGYIGAQVVTDNFSDGDFTHNPGWTGDSSHFIVNASSQLQLVDTSAGQSCLATSSPGTTLRSKEWRFWIRENFSPSSHNYGRVYLVSDRRNLKDSLNGYYLQFGEAGSNDAVELFRQTGLTSVSVCRGINGEIASPFRIGVKVTRDSLGKWSLFVDPSGGVNYAFESSGTDTTIISTAFFGVLAVYTVSNDSKFYWTDFYAGPVYVNKVLPRISSVQVLSDKKLDLLFNEALDSLSASKASNYFVNQGLGNPATVLQDNQSPDLVHLEFASSFSVNFRYELEAAGLKNKNGYTMIPDSMAFWRYVPSEFDVVINEIMANPKPPVGLPPYEYIELYNRKDLPIKLDNWKISIGSKEHLIGPVTIGPDSFVVLCSPKASLAFPSGWPVYAVTGFPALNNAGAEITLKTDSGRVMSCISYSDIWYEDAFKKKGGWSLEQIDPGNPCGGAGNWKASRDVRGGSPGIKNSIDASNPDKEAPRLIRGSSVFT